IRIGTPPKDYHVQVDTGSDLLWVNCVGCQKCPKKSDLGVCSLSNLNIFKKYHLRYIIRRLPRVQKSLHVINKFADPHTMLLLVTVRWESSVPIPLHMAMGAQPLDILLKILYKLTECGSQKSGDMGSSQAALDGILGFGQANSSMLSQLASAKKVKKIFSHCLDGSKGGGIFAIGEVVQPKVKTTPMIPDHGIFGPSGKRGIIIDSGTTLAYLPDLAYKQVMEKIKVAQPKIKSHIVDQQFTCYKYSGNVDKGFPVVTFHFANSLSLKVYPHQYLFEVEDHEWCVGFQDSNLQTKDGKDLTLLGDLVLTDKVVTYDMEKKTIGWIEHNCSSSIKVKDDESGKLYSVSSHNISPAGRINASTGIIVACFMTLMVATFIKQRLD
ncbi:hypothetical protein Ccrd_017252, partial [Cynara cardunculus var. scolymus]